MGIAICEPLPISRGNIQMLSSCLINKQLANALRHDVYWLRCDTASTINSSPFLDNDVVL